MTVEIRGRSIAAMITGRRVRIPRRATVIDGRGKYLVPGLWDVHVHLSFPPEVAQVFLPLMVANGVLGARDMHSVLSVIVPLKRAVASGSQIGPRLFVAGPAVDGPNSILPGSRVVNTADEAREAVRQLKTGGADFIKVYSSLPKELYFAVASEAKKEGIPFVGHVPYLGVTDSLGTVAQAKWPTWSCSMQIRSRHRQHETDSRCDSRRTFAQPPCARPVAGPCQGACCR